MRAPGTADDSLCAGRKKAPMWKRYPHRRFAVLTINPGSYANRKRYGRRSVAFVPGGFGNLSDAQRQHGNHADEAIPVVTAESEFISAVVSKSATEK